jgi:hypothetical protein
MKTLRPESMKGEAYVVNECESSIYPESQLVVRACNSCSYRVVFLIIKIVLGIANRRSGPFHEVRSEGALPLK